MSPIGFITRLFKARWGLLRLGVAAFLLWALATDTASRLVRLQFAALPGFDYTAEVRALRERGRFGEAIDVANAGLESLDAGQQGPLAAEKQRTLDEQSSYWRRAKDVGLGALSGRGESLEGLVGALAADFFVVGDVRDLVIEGTKLALDGDSDELILILSGVGIATTLAPEIDWVPSLFKIAAKTGSLSRGLRRTLTAAIKEKKTGEFVSLCTSMSLLARRASPAGAIRIASHADDAADLARLASFAERRGAQGVFALHATGRDGARLVLEVGEEGEKLALRAARKGSAGTALLRSSGARVLLKPHPIVGLLKGLRKGTLADAVARAIERLDGKAWWLLPLTAAWTLIEGGWLMRRLTARPISRNVDIGTSTPR